MTDSLPTSVRTVRQRLQEAARRAGRDPSSIRLIGASKRRTIEEIQTAHALGIQHFGENYVPECLDKARQLDTADFHFIGHLQRNKAKRLLAGNINWVHTVDTLRLAKTLQRYRERPLHTLIQVNIGGEPTKSGVAPDAVLELARTIFAECPDIGLCGLMTLPPKDNNPTRWFQALADLRNTIQSELGVPLPELSMGMSSDLEPAVACGATMVRVGTALFGPRPIH